MNLVELLYQSVKVHGDLECVRYKQDGTYTSLTYQEFWDAVKRVAAGLAEIGVKFGDKVAILSNNCPEWAMSDFAILSLGAVVVPIYPSIPAEQVAYILNNADVTTAVVQDREQLKKVLQIWPEQLRRVIVISPDESYFELISTTHQVSRFSDIKVRESLADEVMSFHLVSEDQLATIVHTSGTSGNPKGVMLSHRNIVSNVQASLSMLPVEPGDIALSFLPLSHIFERTVGQYAALSSGAAIAYAESVATIPTNLLEVRPTLLISVPRLLEKVYAQIQVKLETTPKPLRRLITAGVNSEKASGITYRLVDLLVYRKLRKGLGGRMRAVVSGSAALAANIAKFYEKAGIPVYEGYGMTEAAPVITVNPLGESRPGTVGKVIPGAEIMIADDGELLVKGPNVMLGYYGAPEETNAALAGGWLHTGDIAEIYDGYVKIVDRKKNILVLATGKNVAPSPIENAISLSPYVSSAILVGDGRKYVACVLAPNVESLGPVAEGLQLGNNVADWVMHPKIRGLIAAEVRRTTEGFAAFEQPKRAVLLANELTLESGDLTPSLKVKTRILMQKYGQQIEDMYNGINFLPIDANTPDEAKMPISPPPSEGEKSMSAENAPQTHHPLRWVAVAGAAVLILGIGTVFASGGHLPKNLNVLGMVQHIHKNNDQINNENGQIVDNLQGINHLADATSTIGSNLHTLKDGMVRDGDSLHNLNDLSQQEADLSQNFYVLAQTLQTDMSGISRAASAENGSVNSMVQQANQLNQVAANLARVNQTVAGKLSTADGKARTIAAEMP